MGRPIGKLRFPTLESGAPVVFGTDQESLSSQSRQCPREIQHENDEAKALVTTFSDSGHAVEDIKMPATPKLEQIPAWEPKSIHWRRLHAVPPPEHWNRRHKHKFLGIEPRRTLQWMSPPGLPFRLRDTRCNRHQWWPVDLAHPVVWQPFE
jgi:hypothetical protein